MMKLRHIALVLISLYSVVTASADTPSGEAITRQVMETEKAFADTMARRDFEGFLSFLSEEAIFFSGEKALRGKQQVGEAWKPMFEAPDAPFSWRPALVEVLDSGTLALSSGPVHGPDGQLLGNFNSIWRYEPHSNSWKIIFDKGSDVCADASP